MQRNLGLDIVRSIAILMVVCFHGIPHREHLLGIKFGIIAVELFFGLSGFLIGQILIRDMKSSVSGNTLVNFWFRRWLRTIPLYYAIVTFCVFFEGRTFSQAWPYYLFLQNNVGGLNFLWVTWSLTIEEWFYLFIPLILFISLRKGFTARGFFIVLMGIILAENLARLGMSEFLGRQWSGLNGNPAFRLDAFAYGLLFALFKSDFKSIYGFFSKTYVFSIVLFVSCLLIGIFSRINQDSHVDDHIWSRVFWFPSIEICFAAMLPWFESGPVNKISWKPLLFLFKWTSVLTYSAYLIHGHVFEYFLDQSTWFTWTWVLNYFGAVLLVFVIGFILYKVIEKPFLSLRDKVRI